MILTKEKIGSQFRNFEEGESNLMQMGVSMYSARIGRFLSVDPLHELMPSHNPYHYAFNSPLVWKDPSGLAPEKDKNIHSEKLLRWIIKFESAITDETIVTASRYEIDYTSAEYDAGFADDSHLRLLGGYGSGGGGGGVVEVPIIVAMDLMEKM